MSLGRAYIVVSGLVVCNVLGLSVVGVPCVFIHNRPADMVGDVLDCARRASAMAHARQCGYVVATKASLHVVAGIQGATLCHVHFAMDAAACGVCAG